MSLSDLASLGSFVSGVAVLATLILVFFQMRQANLNQRSLMQQARASRAMNLIMAQAEPAFSAALTRAGVQGLGTWI